MCHCYVPKLICETPIFTDIEKSVAEPESDDGDFSSDDDELYNGSEESSVRIPSMIELAECWIFSCLIFISLCQESSSNPESASDDDDPPSKISNVKARPQASTSSSHQPLRRLTRRNIQEESDYVRTGISHIS